MMLLSVKQHLSMIGSSIHEKAKQMLSGKKCVGYKKSVYFVGTYNGSVF